MMNLPIRELLDAHTRFEKESSLPENIGDGLLYSLFPVYRKLRDRIVELGFGFSREDRFGNAFSPFSGFARMREARTLHYRDTASRLGEMDRAGGAPIRFSDLSFMRGNTLARDSARFILLARFPEPQTRETYHLAAVFGLAHELLLLTQARDPVQRALLAMNLSRSAMHASQTPEFLNSAQALEQTGAMAFLRFSLSAAALAPTREAIGSTPSEFEPILRTLDALGKTFWRQLTPTACRILGVEAVAMPGLGRQRGAVDEALEMMA
jgi:hypothetical protein